MKFNDIPASAPLFRGATVEQLDIIVRLLSRASFAFADDDTTRGSWRHAQEVLASAAEMCNMLRLDYDATAALVAHKPQLVTHSQLINTMLKLLHRKG